LHIMADTAKLGPAPDGMIKISHCINNADPTLPLPEPICTKSIETISIKEAAQATMQNSVTFILILYYLTGAIVGNSLSLINQFTRASYQYLAPKIRPYLNRQMHNQLQEDVNWCASVIEQHFEGQPYWEETVTAYFTRGDSTDVRYWKMVNQIATKRCTETPKTLLHVEAYREMNRMALFSINVMAGALLDCRYNTNINKKKLEDVLKITHDSLSIRAPNSLSEHDDIL
ncbi:hypothetical protein, partial [Vibrio sp. F13]